MKKSSRVYWVDILRTIALIYMVIYHIFVVTNIKFNSDLMNSLISFGGEIGVSVFFVISGFSIYKSIEKKKEHNYKKFLKERIRRIGPHYYISLLVALLFTPAVVYLSKEHLLNIISHIFFIHNLFYDFHGAISGVLWTMGVIVQFYLVAPILKKCIDKKPILTAILSILCSFILKYFIYNYLNIHGANYWYYFIYGRQLFTTLDAFVLGMVVSKYSENKLLKINNIGLFFSIISLLVFILYGASYFPFLDKNSIYSFSKKGLCYFYILDLIIALVIYFITKIKYKNNFVNKILLFISRHEYAIYVWHLLILNNFMNSSKFISWISKSNALIVIILVLLILIIVGVLFDTIISNINYEMIFINIKKIITKIRGVNMKKYIKEIWPSYILSIVISFMLFLYEPIVFYSNNVNDLWFDLGTLLNPMILVAVILSITLIITFTIVEIISKKIFKILYLLTFIGFIYLYIQGNFLVGSLPVLDGTPINWSLYNTQNIISILLLIVICTISIVIFVKMSNFVKKTSFITFAVLVMLSTSLISTLFTTNGLKNKDFIVSTTFDNLNTYSSDKNFIILLLDATDSKYFFKAIENNKEFKHIFDDFTYYPDTLSGHPFTTESIAYILTGERYIHQEEFSKWETNAMKNAYLLNTAYDKGYELNLYDRDFIYNDEKALQISNAVEMNGAHLLDKKSFIKEELRYILFRYLPYPLKKYSKIENMDLGLSSVSNSEDREYFYESNFEFIQRTTSEKFELKDKKQFKYIHLDGAHIPFTFDKNLNDKIDGNYYDEVEGMCTLVNNYLKMLKEKNVYDNSTIIVMADHGYNVDASINGRQNPILFIKGINEKNNKMNISNKAISFSDLNSAYKDLFEDKKSIELFSDINENRTRKYLLYRNDDKIMTEYEINGKAWETEKMVKTGEEFYPISK